MKHSVRHESDQTYQGEHTAGGPLLKGRAGPELDLELEGVEGLWCGWVGGWVGGWVER